MTNRSATLPTFRGFDRIATSFLCAARRRVRSSLLFVRRLLVAGAVSVAFTACSDSPVAPKQSSVDRVDAARVVPAVMDARVRVAAVLVSPEIRARVEHDLADLQAALSNGDATAARFHVRVATTVLAEYRVANPTEAPDVSAIELALTAVTRVLDRTDRFTP